MLFALTLVLIALWALALGVFGVTGNLIHLLLVLAMVSLAWHLIGKRRRTA